MHFLYAFAFAKRSPRKNYWKTSILLYKWHKRFLYLLVAKDQMFSRPSPGLQTGEFFKNCLFFKNKIPPDQFLVNPRNWYTPLTFFNLWFKIFDILNFDYSKLKMYRPATSGCKDYRDFLICRFIIIYTSTLFGRTVCLT